MFRILTKRDYDDLVNQLRTSEDTYNQDITSLAIENKDYELKLQKVHDMLVDIFQQTSSASKDITKQRIKSVLNFIEKGKQ